MNKSILIGRLCDDPEVRYTQGTQPLAIARCRLAVDRRFKKDGEPTADFIPCLAFGKTAEFVEKYLKKGSKIAVAGRIQTGSYKNQEGRTIYTWEVVVEEVEFAESKQSGNTEQQPVPSPAPANSDGFMDIPPGLEEELPFN